MLAKIKSSAISGIDAAMVEVEVQISNFGKQSFTVVGLGDAAVRESKQRVSTALAQSGFPVPAQIVVNLAPADVKKEGASFDLPMALGVLFASEQLTGRLPDHLAIYGELSLDGCVKPIRGVVALTIEARRAGLSTVIVPRENVAEASLITGIKVVGIGSLAELVSYLTGEFEPQPTDAPVNRPAAKAVGFSEVQGQERAKRALTIAAAGGHNLLMVGPPGCGKSMLAERLPGILPRLSEEETLEVMRIHSVAGLPIEPILAGERPFRAPHHVISDAGLIGGGSMPRPGEISLAHRGVLFLDEFPEYRRSALEALRAPLESGIVQITRAKAALRFPAKFQLLAAMNPCPCGRLGAAGNACRCSAGAIERYLQRLSQPILDRIDLQVEMDAVPIALLGRSAEKRQDSTAQIVADARRRAAECRAKTNSELSSREVRELVRPTSSAMRLLEAAEKRTGLSARGVIRVFRVAQTIADLARSEHVDDEHIAEALGFRSLERIRQLTTQVPRRALTN